MDFDTKRHYRLNKLGHRITDLVAASDAFDDARGLSDEADALHDAAEAVADAWREIWFRIIPSGDEATIAVPVQTLAAMLANLDLEGLHADVFVCGAYRDDLRRLLGADAIELAGAAK